MFALLLALLAQGGQDHTVFPPPPAPATLCNNAFSFRNESWPISPSLDSTEIVHTVAIAKNDHPLGWLAFRRDGKLFYIDGIAFPATPPDIKDSTIALRLLGLGKYSHANVSTSRLIPLDGPVDLRPLVTSGLGVYTCF